MYSNVTLANDDEKKMKALEKQVARLAKQNESLIKKFNEFSNKMEKKCESWENKLTLVRKASEEKDKKK